MQYIKAKTIVTNIKPSPFWFMTDYNMNIYRGCCHGCIYCDSRSDCYRIDNFDQVKAKQGALSLIERDLKGKRKKGVVATGAMSDPYNPAEENLLLTRGSLELVDKYRFGLSMATKSPLITRDKDIIKRIAGHSNVIIKVTVTTADDALAAKIEPAAASTALRFAAVKELADEGIFVGILLMPVLPFINDTVENITGVVRGAARAGAKFIYASFGVTLRANQRDYYYAKLDKLFPGVSAKYKEYYGDAYSCVSPHVKMLMAAFKKECRRYGILYEMKDIIAAYKTKSPPAQLSLFE
ncbi:DNA repair photolyase [Elusimicrobium simillimum]|uniref:SPL family radical SAM protein n=1 Tax=Elusimicrobium simillimum TaxID=3143438 RepID=UPI003C6F3984